MNGKGALLAFGLFVLFVCYLPLEASEPNYSEDELFEMSLEALMEIEVDSVYGVSRYEQKVTEAPSFVTIITAEDIQRYGYRTLADVLRSVTGFYVTYDRMYNYVGVRGFNRPGDANYRIQLLLDGRRVNDVIFESAMIGDGFVLDIDLIDRIEIIRGPGSSLYGSNAFFAVINIISKKGQDFNGFEAMIRRASYDTHKERGTWGYRFDNGLDVLLSFSYLDSRGQNFYFNEFDDPSTNNGVARHADKEKAYNAFIKVSYGDITAEGGFVRRRKHIPTAAYSTLFNDNRTQLTDQTWFVDLKYTRQFEKWFDFMGRLFYSEDKYNGDYAYDYDPPVILNHDTSRDYWWGGEVQFTKVLFDSHKLVWGGEYVDNGRQDQANFDEEGVYLNDKRESERWGLYIQDEFDLFDRLKIIAGLRRDNYSQFGGTTNPRLAAIYSLSNRTTIKAIYGEAFRAPSPYELYYGDSDETQKGNPDLKPETIKTYELVVQHYITDKLWANLSGFVYKIEDLIELQTDPADDLLVHKNSSGAKAKGFEIELNGRWDNGVSTRAGYTFAQAENEATHSRLTNSPRHLAKFNISLPLYEKKIFAGIEVQYTSKRKTLANDYADHFFVTNLTIFGKEIFKNLDFSFSIYNLFDKKYSDPVSDEHEMDTITQDGRSFVIQLKYRW